MILPQTTAIPSIIPPAPVPKPERRKVITRSAPAVKSNGHAPDPGEQAVSWERSALGALLLQPSLWAQAAESNLSTSDFLLADHRTIFSTIAQLNQAGDIADLGSVITTVLQSVSVGYVSDLCTGVLPESFPKYVREVLRASRDRQFRGLHEALGTLSDSAERLAKLEQMRGLLEPPTAAASWRTLFHSSGEIQNVRSVAFAINGFLQDDCITFVGGLPGHGKTLVMLAMCKALLEGSPLFGYEPFAVGVPAKRILYLVPESGLGPIGMRLRTFKIDQYAGNDESARLFLYTLNSREQIDLTDSRLLKAAEGSHVFLDTAIRFMSGSENEAESSRTFAQQLFALQAAGARTITGAHHAKKEFEKAEYMALENVLRGSGDLGAMLGAAWGLRQVDNASTRIYVENIKARDFEPCASFVLQGRPDLDQSGQFTMLAAPGTAGELRAHLAAKNAQRGGRPVNPDKSAKLAKALELRASGITSESRLAKQVGIDRQTLRRWLFEYDSGKGLNEEEDSKGDVLPN